MKHNTVYKIINQNSGKFYIGIHATDNIDDGYMGSGTAINRAYKKYEPKNFIKQILFDFDNQDDMIAMEELLVDGVMINQKDCYNMKTGGDFGRHSEESKIKMSMIHTGKIITKETREKLRIANIGRKHTKGAKQKISEMTKGKIVSKETKQKLSNALKGKIVTEETKKKLSKANKGKKHSEETKKKLRIARVKQIITEETKEKTRQTNLGKKHSEGTKRKIELAHRMRGAYKRKNFNLLKILQKVYKKEFGEYHSKYLGVMKLC